MNSKTLAFTFASFLLASTSVWSACEFKQGETKFLDYANCRYGEDSIEEVNLTEDTGWEKCIFLIEAFRPPKLLAVTQEKNGKELLSINDRSKIGNPCYLTKQRCEAAYDAAQE
ncbi:MAG: hypothetical protein IMF09_11190 [Proteobacteria bacterium]|nr:hypothetical protein [Pseudomonadota bacterium]